MGTELTELPPLDLEGRNLVDYVTYVRKVPSGGALDFRLSLAEMLSQTVIMVATNKTMMRSFAPQSPYQICFCLGGTIPNDNAGGIYFTVASNDLDNDGDRIRPDNFNNLVWYKWLI